MGTEEYELLDHTADLWIRVKGRRPGEIFSKSARALLHLATGKTATSETVERTIELEGNDYEQLLVRWLNELLFLLETEELGFSRFSFEKVGPEIVLAKAYGEQIDLSTIREGYEIKSATYHKLRFEKTPSGYEASVVLDI